MDERPPITIRFDSATGTLSVETGAGRPSLSLEELGPLASAVLMDSDDEERSALFVSPGEADALLKMVNYILDKIKVTEASRLALTAVKPRLEALRDQFGA